MGTNQQVRQVRQARQARQGLKRLHFPTSTEFLCLVDIFNYRRQIIWENTGKTRHTLSNQIRG